MKIAQIFDESVSLEDIANQSQRIQREADNLTLSNESITSRLKGLYDDTLSYIDNLMTGDGFIYGVDGKATKQLTAVDFTILMDMEVIVPKGLSVTWLEYAEKLLEVGKVVQALPKEVFIPVTQYLGQMVTNPTMAKSSGFEVGYELPDFDKSAKMLAECLSKENTVRPLVKCIRRSKDWKVLDEKVIALSTLVNKDTLNSYRQRISDIENYIDSLMSGEVTVLAPAQIKRVSQLAHDMAVLFTFYGNYSGQVLALISTYEQNKTTLVKML